MGMGEGFRDWGLKLRFVVLLGLGSTDSIRPQSISRECLGSPPAVAWFRSNIFKSVRKTDADSKLGLCYLSPKSGKCRGVRNWKVGIEACARILQRSLSCVLGVEVVLYFDAGKWWLGGSKN
ncbi:hypothetical protein Drorol1_Dr00001400 [Drosera rotundifolia]